MDIIKTSLVKLVRCAINGGLSAQVDEILTTELLDGAADADLYYLAGNVKLRAQAYDDAFALFVRASELAPWWASPLNNAGICHERRGDREEAYRFYARAAELAPSDRLVVRNAAYVAFGLKTRQFRLLAASHLMKLLEHYPQDSAIHSKLGYVYFYLGETKKALEHASRAVELNPQNVSSIVQKVAFHLPIVYETVKQIDAVKSEIGSALGVMEGEITRALAQSPVNAEEFRDIWCDPLFYLTYNGRSNLDLLGRFNDQLARIMATTFARACERAVQNRRVRRSKPGRGKIRIAFVSAFFCGHSIWKIPTIGYYENLDRDKFEVYTYHMGASHDRFTEHAKSLSDSFYSSTFVGDIVERLATEAPDVVVFPDVGMNFSSYCLTCLRLAPVQVQLLGHPDTSGAAAVDYVISSEMMESPDAQDFYREKIVPLPGLGCTYSFDYPKPADIDRAFFNLDQQDVVFVSPQSTFKYVPEDDDIYPLIAARIGERCRFIFFPRSDEASINIFVDRLKNAFERHGLSYEKHVRCQHKPLTQPEFVALCACGDVFLDNPSWSGHNTALDALHGGTLVLCLEGLYMRQRHAAALMRYLGFAELVAPNKAGLVELCVRYAADAAYRTHYRTRLAVSLQRLASKNSVRAFEKFIIEHADDATHLEAALA